MGFEGSMEKDIFLSWAYRLNCPEPNVSFMCWTKRDEYLTGNLP